MEVELLGVGSGPLPDLHNYNINGIASSGVKISNVKVTGGSTGIELNKCNGAQVSNLVAINMRGRESDRAVCSPFINLFFS